MSKLYIAYGSNMNKRQMRLRCPTARPLGKFTMKDARLVFRVYADLELKPGTEVPCVLWSINELDERALDQYEGSRSAHGYYKEYILLRYAGQPRKAMLYLMRSDAGVAPPSQAYVDTIREGYQDFEINQKYLNAAIKHAWDEKAHSDITRARRSRQKRNGQHRAVVTMPESVALRRAQLRP
jgi:hypothetical protein